MSKMYVSELKPAGYVLSVEKSDVGLDFYTISFDLNDDIVDYIVSVFKAHTALTTALKAGCELKTRGYPQLAEQTIADMVATLRGNSPKSKAKAKVDDGAN